MTAALPAIVLLWVAGVIVVSAHVLRGHLLVARIRRDARPWSDGGAALFEQLVARLQIGARFRVVESALVDVPSVIGAVAPLIVVPIGLAGQMPPAQLQALLAHELAHVVRRDYLANVLHRVVEILLFYHPAVWWISRQIRIEREHCCDDLAAAWCENRLEYARALTALEVRRARRASPAMAASGGHLLTRIRRLVEPPVAAGSVSSGGITMSVVLTLLLFTVGDRIEGSLQPASGPVAAVTVEVPAQVATASPDAPAGPTPATSSPDTPARQAPMSAKPAPRPVVGAPSGLPIAGWRVGADGGRALPTVTPAVQQAGPARITGVVRDATGGVIPGADIVIVPSTPGAPSRQAVTTAAGRFQFTDLEPGAYDVAVSLTGFKRARVRLDLAADSTADLGVVLEIGALSETVTVRREGSPQPIPAVVVADATQVAEVGAALRRSASGGPPPVVVATMMSPSGQIVGGGTGPATPVRVGGDIRAPRKIRDVKPTYPAGASGGGVVIIEAVVAQDGTVQNAQVLRSVPGLDEAALAAVREWRYTPTLLNGVAVEVVVTVTVNFVQ